MGVRIPIVLFDLVKAAEPNETFSSIVIGALWDKYGTGTIVSEPISIDRVRAEVDRFLSGALDE